MKEILEPLEKQVEKYTEEDYCEMLNDVYGELSMGYLTWDADYVLRELDPVAYRCGFNDYQEYKTVYECPICKTEFEDFDEAKWCCQIEEEDEDEE